MEPGRRVVVKEYGETPLDAIERHVAIEPQPFPDTASLAPTDVVIRVRSAQVHWVDLMMTSGQYQHMPDPPYVPGLEYAGEVVWAGPEANVPLGRRVLPDGLRTGPRSLGPYRQWGGFATYAVAPADALFTLPERYGLEEGASIFGGYETAYHCLIHRGELRAGESVLIHGATGITGLAAVQIAKLVGATVIATGRSAEKLERVRAEGADHVIEISDAGGGVRRFRDDVKALTGGEGVDVVYDPVGGDISLESLRCIRFGGRFLVVGWSATPFVAEGRGGRGAKNANVLPTNLILMKSLDVRGCPAAISVHKDPSVRVERLAAITKWLDAGALRPLVGATFPLDEIREAMRAKWESRYVGAVLVSP